MPTSRRKYDAPRMVQYGDLVTLTRGTVPVCPAGTTPGKLYGSGGLCCMNNHRVLITTITSN
jgi:hypothetical protein